MLSHLRWQVSITLFYLGCLAEFILTELGTGMTNTQLHNVQSKGNVIAYFRTTEIKYLCNLMILVSYLSEIR